MKGAAHPPSASPPSAPNAETAPSPATATAQGRQPWPATLAEQVAAVSQALTLAQTPLALDQLAERFAGKGPWKKRLPQLLDTLAVLGKAREVEDGRWMG